MIALSDAMWSALAAAVFVTAMLALVLWVVAKLPEEDEPT